MEFDDMIMGKMANENAHPNKKCCVIGAYTHLANQVCLVFCKYNWYSFKRVLALAGLTCLLRIAA